MTSEPSLRPFGDAEPERTGGVPHISDYWQVIARRLWLVLVVFTVTSASSIWAVSRQRVFYQGTLTLQVNDPLQRQRGLISAGRVSGMDIFVDPIESEIQVLRSSTIASTVADSVGLRLRRVPADALRSQLAQGVRVSSEAPEGSYQLAYGPDGRSAVFRSADGTVLGTADVGTRLDAGFLSFDLQPPPDENRIHDLEVVSVMAVQGEAAFAASPREATNIVDVSLIHPDPLLVPAILNYAGIALREKGAERVRQQARSDIDFINERLDSAQSQLSRSMTQIRDFKKTQAFTNLSARERALVDRAETLANDIEVWDRQRRVLSDLVSTIETRGIESADLPAASAQLPAGSAPQVSQLIGQVQAQQTEERRLLTEDRKSPSHPQVIAVRAEIKEFGSQLVEAARASLQLVEVRLHEFGAEQSRLREEQRLFPDLEGQLQALEAQQTLDRESYQFLLSQLYQAQITQAAASPYVEILDPSIGAMQIQGRGRVNVFLGALLGLILGVGAAFFLEYLDRTVRTSSDVESLLGIPVLGIIPRLRRLEDAAEDSSAMAGRGLPLIVAMEPLDPAAEAYRNLRMNLTFMSTEDQPIRSILFTSPGPSEGKSTTAINFAVMLAQQGQRVLVIDADLRRPSLHRALDVLREPGLTNLLIGDADLRETVRPGVLPNLDFLPSGPFPPNPSELLNSKAMGRLLEDLEARYDQIVIDSPPVLAVTDAAVLAVHTDGAVLVLRSGETEQRTAERSVEQLRRLGVRVFGAVLNEVSAASPDESYYLQYYYSYHPSGSGGDQRWKRLREGLSRVKFFG
ncbi:MAG: polysaccharide biosynthesis tyrosine autokinase [Longimicrobiales bacterium]|nr:polysaccharide biosynthesis tyrosine autokinase [Longimicrobiales bacterium]